MAETKTNEIPAFRHGDTVRIELHVQDDSGVSLVEVRFRNESVESVKSIYRSVTLENDADAFVVIDLYVGDELSPGEYVCEYVALTDGKGNKSLYAAPGIEFRVEGSAEEGRGPTLLDWSIA